MYHVLMGASKKKEDLDALNVLLFFLPSFPP
jgi:hypothetical protein